MFSCTYKFPLISRPILHDYGIMIKAISYIQNVYTHIFTNSILHCVTSPV